MGGIHGFGTAAPADPEGLFGTIVGRVEGDTLVLESSGYPASDWGLASAVQFMGSGADVPSSEQKMVVERFSVSEDAQTLIYEFTVDDPVFLEKPFTHRVPYRRRADNTPLAPYNCEVESASQFSRD